MHGTAARSNAETLSDTDSDERRASFADYVSTSAPCRHDQASPIEDSLIRGIEPRWPSRRPQQRLQRPERRLRVELSACHRCCRAQRPAGRRCSYSSTRQGCLSGLPADMLTSMGGRNHEFASLDGGRFCIDPVLLDPLPIDTGGCDASTSLHLVTSQPFEPRIRR